MKKSARVNRLLPFDQYCIQVKDFDQITDDFVERKRKAIEANLRKGESTENEDGESASKKCVTENMVRILEEGELPEDVQMPSATSTSLDIIKKAKPIDFDEFSRKRKVALLIAYCGGGYHGMQKNPDVETIESKLLEALVEVKAVRPQHKDDYLVKNMNTICFQRAARTDKGVSAARQVVATETFIEDMNKALPKEIRVFGIERVTKKFDAKCSCSGRSYEYLVPSFAFAQSKTIIDSAYRLPDYQLEKVKSILGRYVGTHNFHNFTSGKRFNDKSAFRYITKCTAGTPFICRGHEFVALEICGQSFMVHQIRKMIGLCIAICRTYCNMDILDRCFNAGKLDIPKAPGLGLLLNRVAFDQYNRKFASEVEARNPLTFDSCELDVERYKIDHIWHTIIEEEIKKSSIVSWLKTLTNHTYTEAGMTNPILGGRSNPLPGGRNQGTPGQFPVNNHHSQGGRYSNSNPYVYRRPSSTSGHSASLSSHSDSQQGGRTSSDGQDLAPSHPHVRQQRDRGESAKIQAPRPPPNCNQTGPAPAGKPGQFPKNIYIPPYRRHQPTSPQVAGESAKIQAPRPPPNCNQAGPVPAGQPGQFPRNIYIPPYRRHLPTSPQGAPRNFPNDQRPQGHVHLPVPVQSIPGQFPTIVQLSQGVRLPPPVSGIPGQFPTIVQLPQGVRIPALPVVSGQVPTVVQLPQDIRFQRT